MRFSFGCQPSGFHVDAGGIFNRRYLEAMLDAAVNHWSNCSYCQHKIDPTTNRDVK